MANPTRNNNGFGAGFVTNDMAITAILEARSTTKGVLFPRMTTTQRNAIASPAESLLIFNTTTGGYQYYHSGVWTDFGGGATPTLQQVTDAGNEITDGVDTLTVTPQGFMSLGSTVGFWALNGGGLSLSLFGGNASVFGGGISFQTTGLGIAYIQSDQLGVNDEQFKLPNKGGAGGVLALTSDIVTPIAGINIEIDNTIPTAPIINFIGTGATISALDPIIQSNEILNQILQRLFDSITVLLAKDGSNTNATLDLQAVAQGITGIFVKGATIEINTSGEIRKSVISSNLLTAQRAMEMPNYDGTLTTEGFVTANIKTPIAGTGITIDNTDPINPVINAIKPGKVIFTPANGSTVNAVNNAYNIINSSTLLSLTIALPVSPANGDVLEFKFINGITTVTYTGGTVAAPLTNPVIGQLVKYVYDTTNTKWF